MYDWQNVPLNFLVQRMRIIILKKTESTTGISASISILGVAKVVNMKPCGSMELSKGSINGERSKHFNCVYDFMLYCYTFIFNVGVNDRSRIP